jgi:hypothetical protein
MKSKSLQDTETCPRCKGVGYTSSEPPNTIDGNPWVHGCPLCGGKGGKVVGGLHDDWGMVRENLENYLNPPKPAFRPGSGRIKKGSFKN